MIHPYYVQDPYKVDTQKTIAANIHIIDTYIQTYQTKKHSQLHDIKFGLRYILVRTGIHSTSTSTNPPIRRWMNGFLNSYLRHDRPPFTLHVSNIVYMPLSKKPDFVYKYLMDREIQ
jgi:hypothetical protein